jgi:hypothetical protein
MLTMLTPWGAWPPAVRLATAASGLFLLVGLVSGVWKYTQIMASPERRAYVYVDITHRASLMYSFASLVLGQLAAASILPAAVNTIAVALPAIFFCVAIPTYVRLALARTTDNQYKHRTFTTTTGVWMLVVGELGGVLVLLAGVATAAWSA